MVQLDLVLVDGDPMSRLGHRIFAVFALLASIAASIAIYSIGGWKLLTAWLLW